MMELNDSAVRAQGSSEAALLDTLRGELDYEILVFSPMSGLAELHFEGAALSANVIAIPRERGSDLRMR